MTEHIKNGDRNQSLALVERLKQDLTKAFVTEIRQRAATVVELGVGTQESAEATLILDHFLTKYPARVLKILKEIGGDTGTVLIEFIQEKRMSIGKETFPTTWGGNVWQTIKKKLRSESTSITQVLPILQHVAKTNMSAKRFLCFIEGGPWLPLTLLIFSPEVREFIPTGMVQNLLADERFSENSTLADLKDAVFSAEDFRVKGISKARNIALKELLTITAPQ